MKEITHYPRCYDPPIAIAIMSGAYLHNQIAFIKHTGINSEYLVVLEKQLKIKNYIIFKLLDDESIR